MNKVTTYLNFFVDALSACSIYVRELKYSLNLSLISFFLFEADQGGILLYFNSRAYNPSVGIYSCNNTCFSMKSIRSHCEVNTKSIRMIADG